MLIHVHRETAPFTKIKYAPISVKKNVSNATIYIIIFNNILPASFL